MPDPAEPIMRILCNPLILVKHYSRLTSSVYRPDLPPTKLPPICMAPNVRRFPTVRRAVPQGQAPNGAQRELLCYLLPGLSGCTLLISQSIDWISLCYLDCVKAHRCQGNCKYKNHSKYENFHP